MSGWRVDRACRRGLSQRYAALAAAPFGLLDALTRHIQVNEQNEEGK